MKDTLTTPDYEYMVWEEWKEGFARLIENRIRNNLELKLLCRKLLSDPVFYLL